jgi:hypothetical protein
VHTELFSLLEGIINFPTAGEARPSKSAKGVCFCDANASQDILVGGRNFLIFKWEIIAVRRSQRNHQLPCSNFICHCLFTEIDADGY